MSRVGRVMIASIGSGVLVAIIALFVNLRAAAIAALILIPACAALLLLSRRNPALKPARGGRQQVWYRAAGFVLIIGAVAQLFLKNVRATNAGQSLGAGPLTEFAIELALAVFLFMPVRKTR